MIRIDSGSMDIFVNPLTLATEEMVDEAIEGTEQLLAALKFAKKNGKQVYCDHRQRQREGKDPWNFLRYRVSDRAFRTDVAPAEKKTAGSWK